MLRYKSSSFRVWIVEEEGSWAPDFLGGGTENQGSGLGMKVGSPEMAADDSIQLGMEEVQQSSPENESGESSANSSQFLVDNTINEPLTGNKDGPGVQQKMDHQASRVKKKRDGFKKYRSNTLKPSKSLPKKVLPDLNLSNEGGLRKKRLMGIRLRKKPGNKGAVEIGDQI
ncbi:hypothetical protein L1987_87221 [Smallanthus sonchifolius]|nr:hypothetical protein L1987_87221 [Smallanthus sonchifolius]